MSVSPFLDHICFLAAFSFPVSTGRPSAPLVSRGRKKSQPSACVGIACSGRPRCTRRRRVPCPSGSRSISTVLDPGGTIGLSLQPQVKTTRRDGITSTNFPSTTSLSFMKSTWNVPPARGSSWASFPFQRTYSLGWVSSRKTVSGRAAMVMTRSIAFVSTVTAHPPLFFLLRRLFQEAQALVPVGLQIRAQLGDALGPRPVEALCAIPSLAQETRLLQH